MSDANRKPLVDAAESETLRTRGNSMHGNRETLETSAPRGAGRSEKANCRTADMHVSRESDGPIVPQKRANKAGPKAAAESVEGRGPTKGNAQRTVLAPDTGPGKRGIGLRGVREAAKRDKKMRFTALLHHITPEMLEDSYFELKRMAAPGVDGVTWHAYGQDLEERIDDLHGRVHCGTYRAQPSKRAWIAKADGRQRPLGIAALEDKIVQYAVKTVLEMIYEEDFLGFSYGFRPGRSCHNALDALWVGITHRKVNWVLDADICGFFDNIDHEWMLKFLEHRIADRRILRLIRKWLKAGVSEDGQWSRTTERLEQFGLQLHPDKTRLLEFGRYAVERREKRGAGKPETFDFLGFTHCCGTTRSGTFTIKRKSIAKRMRAALQKIKLQLKRRMHDAVIEVGGWLRSVVRGWFNYHAIPGNINCLDEFHTQVQRLWRRILRRRSHKGVVWTWERIQRLTRRWLPNPKILHPYPEQRLIVSNPR